MDIDRHKVSVKIPQSPIGWKFLALSLFCFCFVYSFSIKKRLINVTVPTFPPIRVSSSVYSFPTIPAIKFTWHFRSAPCLT